MSSSHAREAFDVEYLALQRRNEGRVALFAVMVAVVGLVVAGWVGWSRDAQLGLALGGVSVVAAAYALTSTPPLLAFLAITASGFRLDRWICLYAGALGAAWWLALYALVRPGLDPGLVAELPSLGADLAIVHAVFLFLVGLLATLIARAGRSASWKVVRQVVERERVLRLFDAYIAPAAAEKVLSGELSLSGEVREVSVLFADIRWFTTLSARVGPERMVSYLNAYFEPVCEVVARHGGMVNKFMGDGLLAVFGAPGEDPDHALHAARAATEMVAVAGEVVRPDGEPTRIGVGLHAGPVVLGSIGSERRKDYTVIGDTVNTASRIEGITKDHDGDVLASEAFCQAAARRWPGGRSARWRSGGGTRRWSCTG